MGGKNSKHGDRECGLVGELYIVVHVPMGSVPVRTCRREVFYMGQTKLTLALCYS